MGKPFEWDRGLLSIDTAEFDRALQRLRRENSAETRIPARIGELADDLKNQPGIPRREYDRRIRLIVATIVEDDLSVLQAIAAHLREASPEALNALRSLLPAGSKHVAVPPPSTPSGQVPSPPAEPPVATLHAATEEAAQALELSTYSAVALIGTPEEHVRNEGLLRSYKLQPLRFSSLDHLWEVASTGICGFVIAASVWRQLEAIEHRRAIRRICEYSTFLFSRICLDGLSEDIAHSFTQQASDARCGPLDGQKFCHGQDCELSLSDISVLQATAKLLDDAGTANFFPLRLSEPEATLLRLIAEERRHPRRPGMALRLGTRELSGGRSGARVFLLSDGTQQPFVAKVGDAEELAREIQRYRDWIVNWEPSVTNPVFHAHSGSAAISFRLQAAPDIDGDPAPTLDERLEQLRKAEWTESIETCEAMADDLYLAVERAVDRLVSLNSRRSERDAADYEFWLHWPIYDLSSRGIHFSLVDNDWQSLDLKELVEKAASLVQPNLSRGVVHGDIHGRNIVLLDRLPAFIDFALSGPGHPFADLARLDAVIRVSAMRMLLDKRSMYDLFYALYVAGADVASILTEYPFVAASPLAKLAIRTAAKIRKAASSVSRAHQLSFRDFYAMHCIVSSHILASQNPGSGIERLMLSVVGAKLLSD